MSNSQPSIEVFISLDVEEEGLFCGKYDRNNLSVSNINYLVKLKPFFERGIKPTLFCTYSAVENIESCNLLVSLHNSNKVEIAAHLHHWNTPPFNDNSQSVLSNVSSNKLPDDIFKKKLKCLLSSIEKHFGFSPQAFRMGRWDVRVNHWPILAEMGILRDASVRPFHYRKDNKLPNHFLAPNNPYWIETINGNIMEFPLTVTSISTNLLKKIPPLFQSGMYKWGVLTLLPVEYPLWLLKLTTQIHIANGGRTISLAWHSSEMMPGGNPSLPTNDSVDKLLAKIQAYLDWLEQHYKTNYLAISELTPPKNDYADIEFNGDWRA